MPTTVEVDVPRGSGIAARALERRANRMLRRLGTELGRPALRRAELSILITSDLRIHKLNRRHRRENKPTDVLAFPMDYAEGGEPPREGPGMLGDVVISVETARKQAAQAGHDLVAEVTLLLAHGVLHLVGYDHRTRAEKQEMDQLAGELVRAAAPAAPRTRPRTRIGRDAAPRGD